MFYSTFCSVHFYIFTSIYFLSSDNLYFYDFDSRIFPTSLYFSQISILRLILDWST